mgnify:CR=1 FL=1
MSTTSKRIQEGMELRGLKQADLVEKTGISKGALSSYISGRYVPKQNNTFLIAKALNVNEAWLMGADVPMERIDTTAENQTRDQKELNEIYIQLSSNNRERVLTYSKSLLSTQQLDDELLAAHVRTNIEDSPENQQRDLDLMDDDSKWE